MIDALDCIDDHQYDGDLGVIVRDLGRRIGAHSGLLAVATPPRGGLDPVAAWGTLPVWHPADPPHEDSFVARATRSGGVVAQPIDADDDSLGMPLTAAPITYGMGVQVRPHGMPPGVLCLGFAGPPDLDPDRLTWTIESYARVAALCFAEPDAFIDLLDAARRDGVTGCLNQGAVRHELHREVRRSERDGTPLCCCFVDLDRFKSVNDELGHLEGTRVLRRVAQALRRTLRTGDVLGRYGGDEFVIVLPGCTAESAVRLAVRLRSEVQATHRSNVHLDASFGIAEWAPGMDTEALLEAADLALFASKHRGGGLIVAAPDGQPSDNGTARRRHGPAAVRAMPRADGG